MAEPATVPVAGRATNPSIVRWCVLHAAALALLIASAAIDLPNHRYVSGDESWVMEVAYNLVHKHRFGATPWTGFYEADRHWFIALPVFSVLQAGVFAVLGAGIAQARAVPLAAGIVLLSLVSWFAFRTSGLLVAGLASGLLLLARLGGPSRSPGIPLVELSRVARYDLLTVTFVWAALVLLERHERRSSLALALAIGITCGLAALTQFYGIVALVIVVAYCTGFRRDAEGRRAILVAFGAFAAAIAPYAAYIAANWSAFSGQQTLKHERFALGDPRFYLDNLAHEYQRYWPFFGPVVHGSLTPADLERAAIGGIVVVGIVLAGLALRTERSERTEQSERRPGMRILWLSLLVPALFLALFDSTKVFLYALVLVPSALLLAAVGWGSVLRGALHGPRRAPQSAARLAAVALIAGFIALSGGRALYQDRANAQATTPYADLGRAIDGYLPPGATIVGPDRWWFALRRHEYYSLTSLIEQYARVLDDEPSARFAQIVGRFGGEYVVVNDGVQYWAWAFVPRAGPGVDDWLQRCTRPVAAWSDADYGPIQILEIVRNASDPACRG